MDDDLEGGIKVIFFDLFYTLVMPKYNDIRNENDVLGITIEEWERYAEDDELYIKRAASRRITPENIIDKIIEKMNLSASEYQRQEILKLRQERFKRALFEIDLLVLEVLSQIKEQGKRICLISNADSIDVMYWDKSPLRKFFDEAIFSCDAGLLKPSREIYKLALDRMKISPHEGVFIGDGGSEELRGAKDAGMKTMLTGYLLRRDKKEHDRILEYADYYAGDFREILNVIS